MKRAAIYLTIIIFTSLLATSCVSSKAGCPAYGNNVNQYQKEVKY